LDTPSYIIFLEFGNKFHIYATQHIKL